MGKIRGWKRVGKNGWKHSNGRAVVIRPVIEPGVLGVRRPETHYQVATGSTIEHFRTRSQAERFATRWMKAHPNG